MERDVKMDRVSERDTPQLHGAQMEPSAGAAEAEAEDLEARNQYMLEYNAPAQYVTTATAAASVLARPACNALATARAVAAGEQLFSSVFQLLPSKQAADAYEHRFRGLYEEPLLDLPGGVSPPPFSHLFSFGTGVVAVGPGPTPTYLRPGVES